MCSRRFRLPYFHDIRHMKVVRLSASRTGRVYPQEMFLVLIFTRNWVEPRSMVRSEGICHWKKSSDIDPGTVRLVAQRINHYATPDLLPFFTYQNFVCVSYFSHCTLHVPWSSKYSRKWRCVISQELTDDPKDRMVFVCRVTHGLT